MNDNDQFYHPIYAQAKDLQNKFHDMLGSGSHPAAGALQHEIRDLVEDIEVRKNPLTIENRVKSIQNQLKQIERQGHTFMNYDHANYLHHSYEQMRGEIRRLHNKIG